ncbi:MAG TPA: hypothetical protein PKB10_08255, partial [Tepidisphaeraceae bacterium]|nr:hypothetical protein [Tepidisphaeraceae bacterium]
MGLRTLATLPVLPAIILLSAGCATVRITDTNRTATEQFLVNTATVRSIDQLAFPALRDRSIFIDTTFLSGSSAPSQDQSFLVGELRSRILQLGGRLSRTLDAADMVIEVRASALGIDRFDYLLGVPAGAATAVDPDVQISPELAIVKWMRQEGYSSISLVAYWRNNGEL